MYFIMPAKKNIPSIKTMGVSSKTDQLAARNLIMNIQGNWRKPRISLPGGRIMDCFVKSYSPPLGIP